MTVLPDTSIWIDYFAGRGAADELDRLLDMGAVVTCGPVLAELVAGASPDHWDALWLAVGSLRTAQLDVAAWRLAGELARALRGAGASVPLLDLLIAIAAVRADAALWTRDTDFGRIRGVLPQLDLYEPRG